jgi:release factor glutamine methyltransferase
VEFSGKTFACDKRALIPRPETEELVELLAKMTWPGGARLLDVGTGSGVIALSLAAHIPDAEVHGVDVSDDALALAMENAARVELAERVKFYRSDLLSAVDGAFDLIVANLPYVPDGDRETISREVRRDPELAVFGGASGDEIIRRLIAAAPEHLAPGGLLALEIGIGQAEALAAFLADRNYREISQRQDFSGVTRFLLARYG